MSSLRPRHLPLLGLLAATFLSAPRVARAEDEEERTATFAVQNRQFQLGHELHVGGGVLPLNAFTKGLTVEGGYTVHLSDGFAWEVGQFIYSFDLDTGLKQELLDNFQVQPTQIETLRWIASSCLVFKPLYGKFAWRNRSVVHLEMFFALGGGVGQFDNPSVLRGGFAAGGGFRLHVSRALSFRFDARDYGFFKGFSAPTNELHIGLAMSLAFGS
jgi:outer membrane beta-barrel protein